MAFWRKSTQPPPFSCPLFHSFPHSTSISLSVSLFVSVMALLSQLICPWWDLLPNSRDFWHCVATVLCGTRFSREHIVETSIHAYTFPWGVIALCHINSKHSKLFAIYCWWVHNAQDCENHFSPMKMICEPSTGSDPYSTNNTRTWEPALRCHTMTVGI